MSSPEYVKSRIPPNLLWNLREDVELKKLSLLECEEQLETIHHEEQKFATKRKRNSSIEKTMTTASKRIKGRSQKKQL